MIYDLYTWKGSERVERASRARNLNSSFASGSRSTAPVLAYGQAGVRGVRPDGKSYICLRGEILAAPVVVHICSRRLLHKGEHWAWVGGWIRGYWSDWRWLGRLSSVAGLRSSFRSSCRLEGERQARWLRAGGGNGGWMG